MIDKLIFITPNFPNGYCKNGNIFVKDQINVLSDRFHIDVISTILVSLVDIYKYGFSGLGFKKINDNNFGGFLFFIPAIPKLLKINKLIRDIFTLLILLKEADFNKNTLFYIHGTELSLAALFIKYIFKGNYIIIEHSSSLLNLKIGFLSRKIIKLALREASKIISVSHDLAEKIEDKYNVKVCILNNVIDFSSFEFDSPPTIKKDEDVYVIVTVGSLVEIKNHDLLIDAFWSKFKSKKNVILKIIGEGPKEKYLKNKIKNLNANDRIFILGYLSKEMICSELNNSRLFVMSSFYETFCVSVAEAMYCELPIVATKFGGITNYIAGLDGCKLSEFEIDDLGNSMLHFYESKEYKYISNKKFVLTEFSNKNFLKNFQSIIKSI